MTEISSRQRVYSGGPYESKVGYCRATRVGSQVFVSGTTAMKDGRLVGKGDPVAQTRQILLNIRSALEQVGSSLDDVVRYRTYVTRIDDWNEMAPVLAEFFGKVHPSSTLVAVSGLVDPDMLIEIEADALVGSALPVSDAE